LRKRMKEKMRKVEAFAEKNRAEGTEEVKCTPKDGKMMRAYASEVRKTIEMADVIIEVLDARDPLGSRCEAIEKSVLDAGKRVVFVLNKIDLVPKENVKSWLAYLRTQMPTIAFKASTQEQNQKLGTVIGTALPEGGSKCFGAELLMKLLANYCRNKNIKTSIRVGVIGYPNVGKSSIINSLKRKRACNVGALSGITRRVQEVELDKHIRLIDSPGIVLAIKNRLDATEVALKNAIRIENIEDPVAPVQAILRRCRHETLMMHYMVSEFGSCEEFLALVARKLGRLKKGARPDLRAAARHVSLFGCVHLSACY
uniref:Mitochondrial GTPase 1 n=1 Tax=Toxocara canis TaxID=6265 RepID=A0A183U007_TOXCA